MSRSQPLDIENERVKKLLNLKEETEEEKAAGEIVVKTETVDRMFDFIDFDRKPSLWIVVTRPFRRAYRSFKSFRYSLRVFRRWRKMMEEYRPNHIHGFLPFFIWHLEKYIEIEKKHGIAAPECKEYKISTAQEAADIMKRLIADDYDKQYLAAVEEKWGKFPYEKTTYANGSVGFQHLTPDGYDEDMTVAYEKAMTDQEGDLKRLGELMEKNMPDWWA